MLGDGSRDGCTTCGCLLFLSVASWTFFSEAAQGNTGRKPGVKRAVESVSSAGTRGHLISSLTLSRTWASERTTMSL